MIKKNFGLIGASGKMGKEISALLTEHNYDCVFRYDLSGEEFDNTPQVLIDFSLPEALEKSVGYSLKFNCPLIIGTTGLSNEQLIQLNQLGKKVAIVQSYNFSIGIQMLLKCTELLNNHLTDWDIEIEEIHHRFKKDKPSGTALMIKNVLNKDVNISSLRLGNVVGEHSVYFSGLGESLRITHQATSRRTFAEGVLKAVEFVQKKGNGFFTFHDVLFSK
ncbi:MAG: 4-hydroxy-tetrahydrodipicolinate reductase [Ignavibacteriales bacterium]|nr:MAG: 4-hydroxy-tetrahydrodipicolinate reductase [Ignavibacteriales bacterium]